MSSSWFMPKNAGESIKWIKSPCFFCCCNWRCSCPPCFEAAHSPPGSSLSTTRGSLTWDADGLRPTYGPKQLQVLCHFLPQPSINQFFKTKTYNCLTIIHPHPILKFHMVFLFTERSEVFFLQKKPRNRGLVHAWTSQKAAVSCSDRVVEMTGPHSRPVAEVPVHESPPAHRV